jgi:hypothetical protein
MRGDGHHQFHRGGNDSGACGVHAHHERRLWHSDRAAGWNAAFNLMLARGSEATYPDALTFSATGLPVGATATYSPATLGDGQRVNAGHDDHPERQPADSAQCKAFPRRTGGRDGTGLPVAADGGHQAGTQAAAELPGLPELCWPQSGCRWAP